MPATFNSTAFINILGTEDASQANPINRGATVSLDNVFGQFAQSKQVTNPTTVNESIPNGKAVCVYVRNMNGPGGASIQLGITHTGLASHAVLLGPGDVWLYWCTSTTAPAIGGNTQGVTALSVSSGAGTSVYEVYLGG